MSSAVVEVAEHRSVGVRLREPGEGDARMHAKRRILMFGERREHVERLLFSNRTREIHSAFEPPPKPVGPERARLARSKEACARRLESCDEVREIAAPFGPGEQEAPAHGGGAMLKQEGFDRAA